jgi:hypothetical protein
MAFIRCFPRNMALGYGSLEKPPFCLESTELSGQIPIH